MKAIASPSLEEARQVIEQALRDNHTLVLVGSCSVNYDGRAGSILPEGERVIIIKPDGTLLVHQKERRDPVNWNPPGCKAKAHLSRKGLEIVSTRDKPKEVLSAIFRDVKLVASFELIDEAKLCLVGTEDDLVENAYRNPEMIEEGFKPIEKELATRYGSADIYGVDCNGNRVVVEFKRDQANLNAVDQLKRYVEELKKKTDKQVRGILVAPRISPSALRLLEKEGLEYSKIEKHHSNWINESLRDTSQKKLKEFTE